MRALVLALCLVATPAAAADQFDLVCTAKKASERYRVDLARGEWCFDKCENVQKIASITTGMITLAEHQPGFSGDRTSYNRVNRVTGDWQWYHRDPREYAAMDHRGKCEVQPFSGIPATKF